VCGGGGGGGGGWGGGGVGGTFIMGAPGPLGGKCRLAAQELGSAKALMGLSYQSSECGHAEAVHGCAVVVQDQQLPSHDAHQVVPMASQEQEVCMGCTRRD
jgi:hypothetical protein